MSSGGLDEESAEEGLQEHREDGAMPADHTSDLAKGAEHAQQVGPQPMERDDVPVEDTLRSVAVPAAAAATDVDAATQPRTVASSSGPVEQPVEAEVTPFQDDTDGHHSDDDAVSPQGEFLLPVTVAAIETLS